MTSTQAAQAGYCMLCQIISLKKYRHFGPFGDAVQPMTCLMCSTAKDRFWISVHLEEVECR